MWDGPACRSGVGFRVPLAVWLSCFPNITQIPGRSNHLLNVSWRLTTSAPAPNARIHLSSSPSYVLQGKKHLKVDLSGVQSTCPFLIFQCSRGTRNAYTEHDVSAPCSQPHFLLPLRLVGSRLLCISSPIRATGAHLSTVVPTTAFSLTSPEEDRLWGAF